MTWYNNTWSVTFLDSSTDDNGVVQVVVYWGDGSNTVTTQNASLSHTYNTKGNAAYTVTQKVTDTKGNSVQKTYTDPVAFGNFSISGKVATTSIGTTGIANATVTLKNSTGSVVAIAYTSSATATKGNFIFNNLKPGTYTMTVTKSPYTFTTDTDLTKTVGPNKAGFVIAPNGL